MKKVTIIGSGISGLSISRMLSGKFDVEILEKSDKTGGLIKCDRIDGNLFHRVGGHVFNSKNETVLDWFWQHFNKEKEFLKTKRNAKILFDDKLTGYPVENYLYQLPGNQGSEILKELTVIAKNGHKPANSYSNFKDFLIGNFGIKLYDLYFGPYNTKIWNTDISNVPLEWLDGKLPMPRIDEIIASNILKKEESEMVHSTFYYPLRDGSQFIVNRLAEDQHIRLCYSLHNIRITTDKQLLINNELTTNALIYSGDIRKLGSIVEIPDVTLREALSTVTLLRSNGTSNVLCETDDSDISWLYLPEEKYKAHRIIYTGNFSDSNNEGTTRKTCVVEFSGKQTPADMISELNKFPGNLKPLEFNYEPDSYVIQDKETRTKIDTIKRLLAPYRIFLLGRFAEWEYYNMDKCIESAMGVAANISASIT